MQTSQMQTASEAASALITLGQTLAHEVGMVNERSSKRALENVTDALTQLDRAVRTLTLWAESAGE